MEKNMFEDIVAEGNIVVIYNNWIVLCKWWKSFMKRGWYDVRFCKRLETLRKFTMFRVYILRSLGSDGMYLTLTLPTKSKRKRGGHEG